MIASKPDLNCGGLWTAQRFPNTDQAINDGCNNHKYKRGRQRRIDIIVDHDACHLSHRLGRCQQLAGCNRIPIFECVADESDIGIGAEHFLQSGGCRAYDEPRRGHKRHKCKALAFHLEQNNGAHRKRDCREHLVGGAE